MRIQFRDHPEMSIDFTNLRKENQADSRIPTVEVGTPEEDAFRRDLTINSLFFNVNKNFIEDWTARGLDDLNNRICDTPLEPKETFKDDPLRVLRAIRFVSKFGYSLSDRIHVLLVTQKNFIQRQLQTKISRERVTKEFMKTLGQGVRQAFVCVNQLARYGLLGSILNVNDMLDTASSQDMRDVSPHKKSLDLTDMQLDVNVNVHDLCFLDLATWHTSVTDILGQMQALYDAAVFTD